MNLEKQVCSLPLAKRLKELGVPQVSLWYWIKDAKGIHIDIVRGTRRYLSFYEENQIGTMREVIASAFTVAELGEMLLLLIPINWKVCTDWLSCADIRGKNASEADARAKMIIGLIEQGAVDVKELAKTEADITR